MTQPIFYQNISEIKSFSTVETSENKTIQENCNHNSIYINKENKANAIKIIPIKVNPNFKYNTNKNTINLEINKYKKNSVIKINTIKKSKTSMNAIQKTISPSNSTEHHSKKVANKVIKIDNSIKKKTSLLQNVSHSFKSGFKKVFSSSRTKEKKQEVKNK